MCSKTAGLKLCRPSAFLELLVVRILKKPDYCGILQRFAVVRGENVHTPRPELSIDPFDVLQGRQAGKHRDQPYNHGVFRSYAGFRDN